MIIKHPTTKAPGEKLFAVADWNAEHSITGVSRARAYRSTNQDCANETLTQIQFNTENFDNLNEYDNAVNYRFTAQATGYYLVIGNVFLDDMSATTTVRIYIYKNGSSHAERGIIGAHKIGIADVVYLAAGEYVDIRCSHNRGYGVWILPGSENTFIAVHRLS